MGEGEGEDMTDFQDVRRRIETAFADRTKLAEPPYQAAVLQAIHALDRGELRVAEKVDGEWKVNAWLMQAVNLYFAVTGMKVDRVRARSRRATRSRSRTTSRRRACASSPAASRASARTSSRARCSCPAS